MSMFIGTYKTLLWDYLLHFYYFYCYLEYKSNTFWQFIISTFKQNMFTYYTLKVYLFLMIIIDKFKSHFNKMYNN